MTKLTIILLFSWLGATASNDISKVNQIKKDAEKAFTSGNFELAVEKYALLQDSLLIDDEQIAMNLGHAYYQLGNKDEAQSQYQKLVLSEDQNLKSMAYQQLGAISNDPKTLEKAMSYFKESIKSDPSNQDARYNYELVKKKLKEQQDQNQDQQDQDKENQDQDEPSDWAKQLKEQADRLVEKRRYYDAHQLMQDGLQKDPTVQHYSDFIERLGTVSEINRS